jgi:DNA-binding transcriptional MerR regulator
MAQTKGFSIGELSRRSGVPVKTLRFYSDEGLLPPRGRTASGYRLYADEDLVRLDLIRALREAGLGLDRIREVVSQRVSLADALRLQLHAVEAHLRSLKHVASAIRAALRSEPTEQDIRRLCAVTRLSNEERRQQIERFYDRVSEGVAIDPAWKRAMIDASAPALPDEPTPEQLDAWIELSTLMADEGFVASLRASAASTWNQPGGLDVRAWQKASEVMVAEARAARDAGTAPESPAAKPVVERFLAACAAASKRAPDATFRRELRERFARQDPRAARYWELVATLHGRPAPASHNAEWAWFVAASRAHFPDPIE